MGFNPDPGGSVSINGRSDVTLGALADGQALGYDAPNSYWENSTLTEPDATTPEGMQLFDSFAGVDDSAKITAMNDWAMARGTSTCPVILFAPRVYNFNVPIKLFSGLKMRGSAGLPGRTHLRASTELHWTGGSGTSMFIFPPEGQTNQSYPSSGAPRDVTVSGFQFTGSSTSHFMPKYTSYNAAYVLWYVQFHNCSWKTFETVWWGWGTGVSISGQSFVEDITDTPLQIGGSENLIFSLDTQSYMGNSSGTWAAAGKPFIRSNMDKSTIGNVYIEACGTSNGVTITGGTNHRLLGASIVGPAGNPMLGAALRIQGSNGVTVADCVFRGAMHNPSGASGGESANRGYVHISGGNNIALLGNQFINQNTSAPANTPVLYASLATDNTTRVSMNGYVGFSNPTYLWESAASKFVTATGDTSVTVHTGSTAP
jgi:hypothetical protein